MIQVKIVCRGTKPLLMNRMPQETLERIYNKEKSPKNRANPLPRVACESKVYRKDKKTCYIPTSALFSCLTDAGKFVRLDGKRQISTATSTVLPAFLSIEGDIIDLVDPTTKKPATWEVDMRLGRNPNGNDAVCIVRPRFDSWGFELSATIYDDELPSSKIRELFDMAGRRVGLLDFRPARKGPYGTFIVDVWQEKPTQ